MPEKEYISHKDLVERGFTSDNAAFETLYADVNSKARDAIENELKTEIATNHTAEDLALYTELLASHGFTAIQTQEWLEQTVPALHQIEIEWREIVLGGITRARE